MASALAPRSIFAPVIALAFSADQEQDCIDFISKRNENFEVVPISDESQLLLQADGRIAETGYRFNDISFAAVCNAVSGGLHKLFGEISGEAPSKLAHADLWNIPAAVGIYNAALRVRFEVLRERSLLVDHNTRVVDGFIGLNHKFLDNSQFFAIVRERIAAEKPAAIFQRAELVGRELRLYYVDPTSKRSDIYSDKAHSFAGGWYFCNREDSGNSIRTIPCLYTRFGLALLPDNKKYRLVHVGSDLAGKTEAAISRALSYSFDMAALKQRVRQLTEQKLGFVDNKADFDVVAKKLASRLLQKGVSRPISEAIARNAGVVGADLVAKNPIIAFSYEVLTKRSLYDLVCAICRYARNQPTLDRERLQAVAAEFLVSTAAGKASVS